MSYIEGYADFIVEMTREKLGYDSDDNSHDDEVLIKLTSGEKLSKSKHLKSKYSLTNNELKEYLIDSVLNDKDSDELIKHINRVFELADMYEDLDR